MSLVAPFSYFLFTSVGFTRGFVDLWFSFKDETSNFKRFFPCITNGVIISVGYLTIPILSHIILDSVVNIKYTGQNKGFMSIR